MRVQGALTRIYEDTVTQIALFARDPSLKGYDPLVRAVPTGLITGKMRVHTIYRFNLTLDTQAVGRSLRRLCCPLFGEA